MSYILDALRKADAERRGVPAAPGMTEPAVLVDTDDDLELAPPAAARPWIWVLAGIGLALIAALVWNLWRSSAPAPEVIAAAPPVPEAAPMAAPPSVAPAPAAPTPAPADTDTLPRFPPALPDPVRAEPPPRADALPLPRQPPPPGIALVPPPGAAPADRVLSLAELPEPLRRDMPRLTIGGAMYSERAADRMVVINGQVFHEGDTVTREVKLRQVKLKSAVVEFRGQRVEIGY